MLLQGRLRLMVHQMEVRSSLVLNTERLPLFSCLGLLVAACVNRAPEGTFGAALAETGVHDLLKVRTSLTLSANCLDRCVVPQIYNRFVVCNLIYMVLNSN
jgi:hypothetical protein